MHGERVDGDDVDAVVEAADRLLGAARDERRPAVLEAMTYRYRGHSVADAGLAYRSKQEIAEHTAHDPIVRVREQLRADGLDEEKLDAIDRAADERVAAAVEAALASPDPPVDRLAWGMYAAGSDAQFARMRPGSAFGEEELTPSRASRFSPHAAHPTDRAARRAWTSRSLPRAAGRRPVQYPFKANRRQTEHKHVGEVRARRLRLPSCMVAVARRSCCPSGLRGSRHAAELPRV
jgi:Dehydrogenase E1 component